MVGRRVNQVVKFSVMYVGGRKCKHLNGPQYWITFSRGACIPRSLLRRTTRTRYHQVVRSKSNQDKGDQSENLYNLLVCYSNSRRRRGGSAYHGPKNEIITRKVANQFTESNELHKLYYLAGVNSGEFATI